MFIFNLLAQQKYPQLGGGGGGGRHKGFLGFFNFSTCGGLYLLCVVRGIYVLYYL